MSLRNYLIKIVLIAFSNGRLLYNVLLIKGSYVRIHSLAVSLYGCNYYNSLGVVS
jgi:hypothetical protein